MCTNKISFTLHDANKMKPMNFEEIEDEYLIKYLQTGRAEAFKEIYRRYWRRCYGLAFQKTNEKETAQDITQKIFISLWERRQTLSIERLEAYLLSAVRYQVLKIIELRISKEKYINAAPPQYAHENTIENNIFLQDLTQALENALNELPQKTQEIYRLSRFENLTNKDIALQLNISEKAIEYHISQSLKHLRQVLKPFLD
jgi:RNA polymerase sigma-70 factor (ECF subfamily)